MSSLRGLLPQRSTSYVGKLVTITGTIDVTLGDATCAANGSISSTGTIAVTLANATCVATGEVAAATTGTVFSILANATCLATGIIETDEEVELPVGTRITNILTRVRDTLADPRKERWSDERLLRLLDEGQQDVAKQSKILKGTFDLSLSIDQAKYDLPDDLWLITRATFDDYEIPLVSYDLMDERARKAVVADRNTSEHERRNGYGTNLGDRWTRTNWELDTSSRIEALVYDNRNLNEITVYPIPNEDIAENAYTFQNSGFLDPSITQTNSPFGVLTGVPDTDELLDEFGVTIDADSVVFIITEPEGCNGVSLVSDVGFDSPFGLIAEIEDTISTVGFKGDELLGVTVSIDDYTIDTVFGAVIDLYDPAIAVENFNSPFGVITGVNESVALVRIWYIKLPQILTSLDQDLEIPPMFDVALKHYVIGHALRDDIDTQYREMGAESIKLYGRELGIAQETNRTDGTRNAVNFTPTYRSGFE